MSTKNSIFLTADNEHCYHEGADPVFNGDKWIGDKIVLELDKKNIKILINDEEDLIIEFTNPKSEIYKRVANMSKDL